MSAHPTLQAAAAVAATAAAGAGAVGAGAAEPRYRRAPPAAVRLVAPAQLKRRRRRHIQQARQHLGEQRGRCTGARPGGAAWMARHAARHTARARAPTSARARCCSSARAPIVSHPSAVPAVSTAGRHDEQVLRQVVRLLEEGAWGGLGTHQACAGMGGPSRQLPARDWLAASATPCRIPAQSFLLVLPVLLLPLQGCKGQRVSVLASQPAVPAARQQPCASPAAPPAGLLASLARPCACLACSAARSGPLAPGGTGIRAAPGSASTSVRPADAMPHGATTLQGTQAYRTFAFNVRVRPAGAPRGLGGSLTTAAEWAPRLLHCCCQRDLCGMHTALPRLAVQPCIRITRTRPAAVPSTRPPAAESGHLRC